jgi:dephospho-CoA kinase
VGLTGGIGSGKSTVARRLVQLGAVLVDSDELAREVVAPGTDGLAEIVAAFGPDVLDAGGALDRGALAAVVFGDGAARERLNGIVHPRVRRRSDELIAAAAPDAVVVQDVPLLVEGGMAARFPLVVVVHAPAAMRIERLVRQRGMAEADARARVAAQADDEARRAAADVWLENGGAPDALDAAVSELWSRRLVPFEENLRRRRPVPIGRPAVVDPRPEWAAGGARLAARVAAAAGDRGQSVAHVGPTAVPGRAAEDVIDVQLGVAEPVDTGALREALERAGFPWCADAEGERRHGTADPGRPARVHVQRVGSPEWRHTLLVRDWLRAGGSGVFGRPEDIGRAEAWAAVSGWTPPVGDPSSGDGGGHR